MPRFISKLTAFVLTLAVLLSMSGCSEVKQAKIAVEEMFSALQQGDYIKARDGYISQMSGDNDFLGCKDRFDEESFPAYAMHKELFTSIDYKIIKKVSDDPAKVTFLTEVEVMDLSPVADRLFEAAEGYNFMAENNEGQITEDEINQFLTQQMIDISKDYISSGETKRTKSTLEINVCYEKDRVWRVYPDDKLISVLTGGVYERYNSLMQENVE